MLSQGATVGEGVGVGVGSGVGHTFLKVPRLAQSDSLVHFGVVEEVEVHIPHPVLATQSLQPAVATQGEGVGSGVGLGVGSGVGVGAEVGQRSILVPNAHVWAFD